MYGVYLRGHLGGLRPSHGESIAPAAQVLRPPGPVSTLQCWAPRIGPHLHMWQRFFCSSSVVPMGIEHFQSFPDIMQAGEPWLTHLSIP